jgi:hypothetical protein
LFSSFLVVVSARYTWRPSASKQLSTLQQVRTASELSSSSPSHTYNQLAELFFSYSSSSSSSCSHFNDREQIFLHYKSPPLSPKPFPRA